MTITLNPSHTDQLVRILAEQSTKDGAVEHQEFLRNLVNRSHLPPHWERALRSSSKDPDIAARDLIRSALARDINPRDKRFTTLGALLKSLLEDMGLGADRDRIVAIIHGYKLFRSRELADRLAMAYQIPAWATADSEETDTFGPDFTWRGPTQETEFHGFAREPSDEMDVGFLMRMLPRTNGVCRIEIEEIQRTATGFLLAPNLVLTNHHVVEGADEAALVENARKAVLRFGRFTMADGEEARGQEFILNRKDPVVAFSPKDKLDYALLEVEEKIWEAEDLSPPPHDPAPPLRETALHILQHPRGDAMKIAFSPNGITGIYEDSGLIQYATRSAGGSSGSPCFNDQWKVVALHHAQKSKIFGTIREGILIGSILAEIREKRPDLDLS